MAQKLNQAKSKHMIYEFVSFLFFCFLAIIWYASIPGLLMGAGVGKSLLANPLLPPYIVCSILFIFANAKKQQYAQTIVQLEKEQFALYSRGSCI